MAAIDPRKWRAPAAAFTMALIVAAFVRSSIQHARFESQTRQKQKLAASTAQRNSTI
ncbi:hypothetical protein JB92DRAFT_3006529, partial [Gautieria morchelliformis]